MSPRALPTTERLHWTDTYAWDFESEVLATRETGPGALEVALNRTAFYVDSGGQPSDSGWLAGHPVLALQLEEDVVWHQLEISKQGQSAGEAFGPGTIVRGRVDGERRLDHMQQHTGQHILSQAFLRAGGSDTVSFHLGREESTIDLAGPAPSPEMVRAALTEANACILADRPVQVHQVERGELARYPIRKDPGAAHDVLRLIEIEEFDWSACGGTHARRTGEVGTIHVLGGEKVKGLWRVRFLSGRRTLRFLSQAHAVLEEAARAQSIHWRQVPESLRSLKAQVLATQKELTRLHTELGRLQGERIFDRTPPDAHGLRRVGLWLGPKSREEARALINGLLAGGAVISLVGSLEGEKAFWFAARSESLPPEVGEWHASRALTTWLQARGGQGGGSERFAQGSSPPPEEEEVQAHLDAWARGGDATETKGPSQ